jgi:ribose transport system permease protein
MTTADTVSAAPTSMLTRVRSRLTWAGILIPLVVLFVILAIASPPFLTPVNLQNILDQQSATLIIAAAGTLVLIAGGLDLSVGAVYALAGVVAAQVALSAGAGPGIVAGIAVGLGVGLANGLIVTRFGINSLIVTLAVSFIVNGLAALVTGGNLLVLFERPEFGALARTDILGIQSSTWIAVIAVIVLGVILARTTLGRFIYATGGNREAARLSGVPVDAIVVTTFVLSGAAAALGGVLDASRVLSAQALAGQTLPFAVLAGIVVGGTSILGGEGAVWRTVAGVLFIALVGNGFNLLGLDAFYRQITLGVILLVAVGIDAWTSRRRA